MADPRFFTNHGPFPLAEVCARANAQMPPGADPKLSVLDVAPLTGAGPSHLSFFNGGRARAEFLESHAGFCFVGPKGARVAAPSGMVTIACSSTAHAFASVARLFYPDDAMLAWAQQTPVDPTARIGQGVVLGHGVVIGPRAEIGEGTRIGANTVIGAGVAIGRNCEIASNVTITHAYIGDGVLIFGGVQIGQPGFGFASSRAGHVKIPQLGRVVVQDRVEIGAGSAIDRGALGDTVIGEGTKIDNLVQIGHNCRIGRHCLLAAQVGISGSVDVGDFVIMGGKVGVADHLKIGDGARLAALSGVATDLEGGKDYGGIPARSGMAWKRDLIAALREARQGKNDGDG